MIALTVPELQRLLPLVLPERPHPSPGTDFHQRWSEWRRRHQARARWHPTTARAWHAPYDGAPGYRPGS